MCSSSKLQTRRRSRSLETSSRLRLPLPRNRVRELTGQSTVTAASVSKPCVNKSSGINLGYQLSMYGAAYRQGKGIWAIGAMRDLIRRADAGYLAHRPAITNNLNIERVLDLKLDTWYDQAREAVKELCVCSTSSF